MGKKTTRFLVTGDFHISEKFDLSQIRSLLTDIAKVAHEVDAVWILGDIYHTSKPTIAEINVFIDFLLGIGKDKLVHIVVGNHDLIAGEFNSVEWIPKVIQNVTIHHKPHLETWGHHNILFAHYNIKESKMGAYDVSIKADVGIEDLHKLGYTLACLGHVHKYQVLKRNNLQVLHPGSLFYIDIGERRDKKQYSIVELDNNSAAYKITSIPLKPYPVYYLEYPIEELETLVIAKIKTFHPKAKVVLRVKNSHGEPIKKQVLDTLRERGVRIIFDTSGLDKEAKITVPQNEHRNLEEMLVEFCTAQRESDEVVDVVLKTLRKVT